MSSQAAAVANDGAIVIPRNIAYVICAGLAVMIFKEFGWSLVVFGQYLMGVVFGAGKSGIDWYISSTSELEGGFIKSGLSYIITAIPTFFIMLGSLFKLLHSHLASEAQGLYIYLLIIFYVMLRGWPKVKKWIWIYASLCVCWGILEVVQSYVT